MVFLDTRTTRNEDGSIIADVYRKDTHTNKYLDFKSHHRNQHKCTVVKTLLVRTKTIPTMKSVKETETKHVESILRANGNPNNFIKSCSQPRESRSIEPMTMQMIMVLLNFHISKGHLKRLLQF